MHHILESWYQRAAADPQRIVLADAGDHRAIEAAGQLRADGLVEPLMVGRDIGSVAEAAHPEADLLVEQLTAIDHDGPWVGRPIDFTDPLVVAAILAKSGWAEGCVAGASRSTPDVLRTAIRVFGVRPGSAAVSSSFLMVLHDGTPIVFGDCGVIPEPDSRQLAAIAVDSAATYEALIGDSARVAMLSFSTAGSATHQRVSKVIEALEIVRSTHPDLLIDGELQFDAAWVPEIAEDKAPGSPLGGRANVFIFPDLDSGNIAYKITERLAGARAFGPLLQGLDGVCHDLSRGCTAFDMVNVAVIAALQSQARSRSTRSNSPAEVVS